MAKEKDDAAASKKKKNVEFIMKTKDGKNFKVSVPEESLDEHSESALEGIYRKG